MIRLTNIYDIFKLNSQLQTTVNHQQHQNIQLSKQQISQKSLTKDYSSKERFTQISKRIQHFSDPRTQSQINRTISIINQTSSMNYARINKLKQIPNYVENVKKSLNNSIKNVLFVCLPGVPPFDKQFDFLQLPGTVVTIQSSGFQKGLKDVQIIQKLSQCSFEYQAQKIKNVVESQQYKNMDIIFLYHSFGTYNLSIYFKRYGFKKVKGLIEIGGAPIRHYQFFNQVSYFVDKLSTEQIKNNAKKIVGQQLKQLFQVVGQRINVKYSFQNIYHGACFLTYCKSKCIQELFEWNRRFPDILKLIIFGGQDKLFEKKLLTQKAQFYIKKYDSKQNNKIQKYQLIQKFNKKYLTQHSFLIQDKFIFCLEEGKHSLHLQKKYQQIIKTSVYEYLQMILS